MLNPFKNSIYIACNAFAYAIVYVCRYCWSTDVLGMAILVSFTELKMSCVGNLDCLCTEPVEPKFVVKRMNYCRNVNASSRACFAPCHRCLIAVFSNSYSHILHMFVCHITNGEMSFVWCECIIFFY
jgi:hypothetical protein